MVHREAPNRHLMGGKRYQEAIAKDSKNTDKFANLPFKFRKPPKRTQARREIYYVCLSCAEVNLVNKHTVGTTCSKCKKYNRVEDMPHFSSVEELEIYLEEQ